MVDILKQNHTKFLKSFWLLIFLLLPSCSNLQNKQPMIMGMYYPDAREIILRNGWKSAEGMPPYEEIGPTAHHFRDLGYAEVQDCAGDDLSPCNFYFQNEKGEYLRIGTEGEDNGILRKYPRVIYAAIRSKID